jgi:hypothetical protein
MEEKRNVFRFDAGWGVKERDRLQDLGIDG